MSLLFENGDIQILEPVLEEKSEYRLETEVYLPDYLPDIQKLLRYEIIPRVQSRDMLAGRINVEGEAEIRIFYKGADEEKISCVSILKDFSHTVAVSDPDGVYDISTKTHASMNSVRASGPRKFTVKAEVVTCIVAAENKTLQIVESVSDEIEAKFERLTAISASASSEREIRITEVLELPNNALPITSLLYTDAVVKTGEISIAKGRVVVKGELTVKPVYTSQKSSKPEYAEYTFPVSQIFDIPEVDEDYVCDAQLQIVSVYAEPEGEGESGGRKIDCEIVVNSILHAYKLSEYSVVTDVFSPGKEVSIDCESINYLTCYDFYRDAKSLKGQIECDASVGSVINIYGATKIMRVYRAEACMNVEGVILVEIIYKSEEGITCAKKGEIPFQFSFPYNCQHDIRCDAEATVTPPDYTIISGNILDIRCEVSVKASVCSERTVKAITDISIVSEKERVNICPITLYFAEKDESVWEIAKRYGGSMKEIVSENSIDSEHLSEARMLIIPLKQ